jgi:phage terminase large subunit
MQADILIPDKLVPVFDGPARYRGAYGGRGSAKTRTFAKMTAVRGYQWSQAGEEGIILCGREYMNSLDESSMAEIKAAISSEPWLAAHYDVGEKYIRTKDRRIEYAFSGLHHNLDSIKSKARIRVLWVDEAEPVTESAWQKAIPSVREHESEIWVTWNPESKRSATHKRFRVDPPQGSKIAELNWRDNPWFPAVLEQERQEDLAKRLDYYPHIWEGDFKAIVDGAYYAKALLQAKQQGRITRVAADPLQSYRVFCDLGGQSRSADAFTMWVVQFIGREIRVLDYYEAVGQPAEAHFEWLRERGYDSAYITLPHDGTQQHGPSASTWESAFYAGGWKRVEVIKNQGAGAARQRIEAARRVFPSVWFNEESTQAGREALGHYHEKKDEDRDVGLGPEHDWASHGSDAYGLMAMCYDAPRATQPDSSRYGAKAKKQSVWV